MTAWRYQTHHSVLVLHVSIKVSVNEMKETIQAYGQTNGCHWPFVIGAVVLMTFPHGGVSSVVSGEGLLLLSITTILQGMKTEGFAIIFITVMKTTFKIR